MKLLSMTLAVLVAATAVSPAMAAGMDYGVLINQLLLGGGITTSVAGIGAIVNDGATPRRIATLVAGSTLAGIGTYRMVKSSQAKKAAASMVAQPVDVQAIYEKGRQDAEKDLKREEEMKSLRNEIDALKRGSGSGRREEEGSDTPSLPTNTPRTVKATFTLRNELPESCMVIVGSLDGKDFVINPGEIKRLVARRGAEVNARFNTGTSWVQMSEGEDIFKSGNVITFKMGSDE